MYEGWELYCPDNRVLHCTLAMIGEDDVFYKASDLILHEFQKMSGMFLLLKNAAYSSYEINCMPQYLRYM